MMKKKIMSNGLNSPNKIGGITSDMNEKDNLDVVNPLQLPLRRGDQNIAECILLRAEDSTDEHF